MFSNEDTDKRRSLDTATRALPSYPPHVARMNKQQKNNYKVKRFNEFQGGKRPPKRQKFPLNPLKYPQTKILMFIQPKIAPKPQLLLERRRRSEGPVTCRESLFERFVKTATATATATASSSSSSCSTVSLTPHTVNRNTAFFPGETTHTL